MASELNLKLQRILPGIPEWSRGSPIHTPPTTTPLLCSLTSLELSMEMKTHKDLCASVAQMLELKACHRARLTLDFLP